MSHGVALNGCVRLQGWMTMRCELSLKCMPLDLGLMDELAESDASGEGRERGGGGRGSACSCLSLLLRWWWWWCRARAGRFQAAAIPCSASSIARSDVPGAGVGLRPCLWCVRSHVFRAYMTTPEFGSKAEQRRADSSGGGGGR
jgi:hypothetical protein